jgi:3-oxoacyl-[acyl-carrier protein] reductase
MSNQVVFVSGASKGIGRAIALAFAKSQYDVVIHYHQDTEGANKTKKMCETFGVSAYLISFDISNYEAIKQGVQTVLASTQTIDVLVNNAGIIKDSLLLLMSKEAIDSVIDTNLKGTFYLTKHVAKVMAKAKSGVMINIVSATATIGNIGQSNYVASKAGIIGLTKAVAKELARYHVRCNAIAPGLIESNMSDSLTKTQQDQLLSHTIVKHIGAPSDVAQCALFLASEQAKYITGQVYYLDGGMVLGG